MPRRPYDASCLKGLLRSFTLSSMATAFTKPAKATVLAAGP